jgi:hypothetical protein
MDNSIDDLLKSKNIKNPPRIIIGSKFENPTILNRNDASGERGVWAQNDIYTFWKVNFKKGIYDFKFKLFYELKNMFRYDLFLFCHFHPCSKILWTEFQVNIVVHL